MSGVMDLPFLSFPFLSFSFFLNVHPTETTRGIILGYVGDICLLKKWFIIQDCELAGAHSSIWQGIHEIYMFSSSSLLFLLLSFLKHFHRKSIQLFGLSISVSFHKALVWIKNSCCELLCYFYCCLGKLCSHSLFTVTWKCCNLLLNKHSPEKKLLIL